MLVCLATRKGGKGLKKSAAYPPEYGQKVASTHRKYIDPPLRSQEMVFTMIPLVERVSETITEKIYAYWQNNETSARQLSRCCFFWGGYRKRIECMYCAAYHPYLYTSSQKKHCCRPSALYMSVPNVPRRTIRSNCGRWSAIKRICLTSSTCCGKPPIKS